MQDAISSDLAAYDRALDLWQISGAQKATARLIEGMDIHVQGDKFSVSLEWPGQDTALGCVAGHVADT
jgi:hypothetical protein